MGPMHASSKSGKRECKMCKAHGIRSTTCRSNSSNCRFTGCECKHKPAHKECQCRCARQEPVLLAQALAEPTPTHEPVDEDEPGTSPDQVVMMVPPWSPRAPAPPEPAPEDVCIVLPGVVPPGPDLGFLLQEALREEEEVRLIQERVEAKWDAEFGHCFPDLMQGVYDQNSRNYIELTGRTGRTNMVRQPKTGGTD